MVDSDLKAAKAAKEKLKSDKNKAAKIAAGLKAGRDAGTRDDRTGKPDESTKVCRAFNMAKGCNRGKDCKWAHVTPKKDSIAWVGLEAFFSKHELEASDKFIRGGN